MAKVVKAEAEWFVNNAGLAMVGFDVVALANGSVAVAFGGSNSAGAGTIHTGLLNLATGHLGPLTTTLYPGNTSGGLPVTTVRDIELTATKGDDMVVTLHMANSAVGRDGNFALLTQVYDGVKPTGTPHAVNPQTPLDNTYDVFQTVALANGTYRTFYSELGQGANLSDGINMATFRANGTMVGQPKTVIADHPVSFFEANPEAVSASLMTSGSIGLLFKENIASGSSSVLFQKVSAAGNTIGPAVVLQGKSALPSALITLASGKLLAVWSSVDAFAVSTLQGQLLSGTGTKLGTAFDIAASHTGTESNVDAVALDNGGFAVSWSSGFSQPLARMFNGNGVALGNDFSITETGAELDSYSSYGLTAVGNQVIGHVAGNNFMEPGVILGQVFGAAPTVGATWRGTPAGNTKSGTAQDDNLNGLGGNDKLTGLAGNDILTGGLGKDTISGGAGHDVIRAGGGGDKITGGSGSDIFVFDLTSDGRDIITDFRASEGDKLGFDNVGFGRELFPGFFLPYLAATVTNGANTDANASGLFFNTTTHVLSFDADGAAAGFARVELAVLQGVSTLSMYDLVIT